LDGLNDTIAAIATAPGEAGLAVVRVSGMRSFAIAGAVFRGAVSLADVPSHTLHHGWIEAAGARVDEVVAAVFRAPRSYTCEDVVEISGHGGASAAAVLEALLGAGARLARPGEFTLRAFLNGRIDLAQAEAVADTIHAETESARRLALAQLAGELSRKIEAIRTKVEDLLAEVEARVDFAEDVGGVEVPLPVIEGIAAARSSLDELLAGAAFARAVREGVRVPLVGAPNAGKSSLFNRLVGEERAIVSDEPGTTRDRVSEPIDLGGMRVVLSDTAGLREDVGAIEAIGVARTRELLHASPLVLWVVDTARELEDGDRAIAATLATAARAAATAGAMTVVRRVVVALNKSDLPPCTHAAEVSAELDGAEHRIVSCSAHTGSGLATLRRALAAYAGGDAPAPGAVANPRHAEALGRSAAALERAAVAARSVEPGEFVALELRESLTAIGEVTGQSVAEDLLEKIFARFCVGK
jgi:tRNA modification GTPase